MNNQQLLYQFEILQPDLQKQAFDFIKYLVKQQQKQSLQKRTIGEYKDKIRIHDNFDTPLSDEFWINE